MAALASDSVIAAGDEEKEVVEADANADADAKTEAELHYRCLVDALWSTEGRRGKGEDENGKERVPAVRVQFSGTARGKILINNRRREKGDVVFKERPLVFAQSNKQEVPVCHHCGQFVGSLETIAELAAGIQTRAELTDEPNLSLKGIPWCKKLPSHAALLSCTRGCGEIYCSSSCRDRDMVEGHQFLCTGPCQEDDPLITFILHAMETNDIFLMAAKVVAHVVALFESNSENEERALLPFKYFKRDLWENVVGLVDEELSAAVRELAKVACCSDCLVNRVQRPSTRAFLLNFCTPSTIPELVCLSRTM